MSPISNPVMLRIILAFFLPAAALVLGIMLVRALRRNIQDEAMLPGLSTSAGDGVPLHLYNTVIQELKQQKHELAVHKQTEQRRARIMESLHQAIFTNLPSGVLLFDLNGLVKQANPSARDMLGFASASGLSAEDVFRRASSPTRPSSLEAPGLDSADNNPVADELRIALNDPSLRHLQTQYSTPSGQRRHFAITIFQVRGSDGIALGAACLMTDLSEFENIRRAQELHGQVSAELALDLRTSLATISGYAQQLASSHDPELARQIAGDISAETSRLNQRVGGFLAGQTSRAAAQASAGATS